MLIKIECPTLAEIWKRFDVGHKIFVTLVYFTYIVINFWFLGFEQLWIVFLPFIVGVLGAEDDSPPGKILASVIGKGREKPVAFICCALLLVLIPGLFVPLSADGITGYDKSRHRLNLFSTYTTMDGVRLHNSCWFRILEENYDSAMLIDKDNDGFSQYCEAYDESYIVTNNPMTTQLDLRFLGDGRYIIGTPFVWENIQTADPSKAIAGYEIIFQSVDVQTGKIRGEEIESCPNSFDASQRVFSCLPSQETVQWLTLNAMTPIYMTIRSYDFIGRRTLLHPELPIRLAI